MFAKWEAIEGLSMAVSKLNRHDVIAICRPNSDVYDHITVKEALLALIDELGLNMGVLLPGDSKVMFTEKEQWGK